MGIGNVIAVVGGTGRYGRPVVAEMVRRGYGVRLLAHRAIAAPPGVEVRRTDLADRAAAAAALRGVTHLYVNPPATLDPQAAWIFERDGMDVLLGALPREAGIVKLSEIDAENHAGFDDLRFKHASEERIRAATSAHVLFRPTWFMDALTTQLKLGPFVIGTHLDNPVHWIHSRDAAHQICNAIERWDDVRGRTFVLQGPEALSIREAVRTWNRHGRSRLRTLPVPSWLLGAAGLVHAESRFVAQLMRFYGARRETFAARTTWDLLGAPRVRLADMARDYVDDDRARSR